MAVPSFLQTQTGSVTSNSNSISLSFPSAVRESGMLIGPSTLIACVSYDGNVGNLVSSITDSLGNSWARLTSASNSAGVNGEFWYAYNSGFGSCAVTINLSTAQKITAVIAEVDQVRPVSPLDQVLARIDTSNSSSRTSASSNSTRRNGMLEVVIGAIAWNNASLNVSSAGSGFTQLTSLKDGTTNIGAAIDRRATDLTNLSGPNSIGRFTMSAATTTPCAVMSAAFYRDGIVTSNSEDGYIGNIGGLEAVDNTSTYGIVSRTSTSAPSGDPGSEVNVYYAFFPDYSGMLLPGVTISEAISLKFNILTSFNDGMGYFGVYLKTFKANQIGNTLDVGDWPTPSPNSNYALGDGIFSLTGAQTVPISKAADYNLAGLTAIALDEEGDSQGYLTSNYLEISTFEGNSPAYLVLELNYPQIPRLRTQLGAGI